MISPSESGAGVGERGAITRLPLRATSERVTSVSRLEFSSLDEGGGAAEIEIQDEIAVPEGLHEEELARLERQLNRQTEQMEEGLESARCKAKAEARIGWERELEERIADERSRLVRSEEEFRRERAKYFAEVEGEVVKLALAIAERVLHREAKLDPLLLSGVVRVALEKIADDSTVVLRVAVGELEMWRRVFAAKEYPSLELAGDERMEPGECLLETNVGRVELGVKAQLQEIERGFFDLMQQRPA